MNKVMVDSVLIEKAAHIMRNGPVLTGHGLTRKELRALEHRGYVKKHYRKNEAGTIMCAWELSKEGK